MTSWAFHLTAGPKVSLYCKYAGMADDKGKRKGDMSLLDSVNVMKILNIPNIVFREPHEAVWQWVYCPN